MKAALDTGRPVLGPNLQLDHPWVVEMIGLAGFDFVLLDEEHGSASQSLPALITAAEAAGIAPLVRVPSHDRGRIIQALELGAMGIQVPMVDTARQAAAIVAETKYAPMGLRGFSNATRAARFGAISAKQLLETANAEQVLIVQLESAAAFANATDIAGVAGVDVVFLGPADYAQSIGHPGDPTNPEVLAGLDSVIERIRGAVHIGIGVSPDLVPLMGHWSRSGVGYFLSGSTHTLREAFANHHAQLRDAIKRP